MFLMQLKFINIFFLGIMIIWSINALPLHAHLPRQFTTFFSVSVLVYILPLLASLFPHLHFKIFSSTSLMIQMFFLIWMWGHIFVIQPQDLKIHKRHFYSIYIFHSCLDAEQDVQKQREPGYKKNPSERLVILSNSTESTWWWWWFGNPGDVYSPSTDTASLRVSGLMFISAVLCVKSFSHRTLSSAVSSVMSSLTGGSVLCAVSNSLWTASSTCTRSTFSLTSIATCSTSTTLIRKGVTPSYKAIRLHPNRLWSGGQCKCWSALFDDATFACVLMLACFYITNIHQSEFRELHIHTLLSHKDVLLLSAIY